MKLMKEKLLNSIYFLNQFLNKIRILKELISNFYDKILILQQKLSILLHGKNPYIYNVIQINPNIIKYHLKSESFNLNRDKNIFTARFIKPLFSFIIGDRIQILAGDWDNLNSLKEVKKTEHFYAFEHHFINKNPWEATDYYNMQLKEADSKDMYFRNKKDIKLRFKNYDELFNSISKNGYISQIELINKEGYYDKMGRFSKVRKINDEISIAIGRKGTPILSDGIHRLVIAQILNFKKIPAYVNTIHPDYFKKEN